MWTTKWYSPAAGELRRTERAINLSSLRCEVPLYCLLPLKDQGIVVLGMYTEKENPSQKWDYEQSEQASKRRERGDRVMVEQTSYYTLSKLLTACTVIFVSRWDRRSHSNAKEVFMSTFGTQSWEKNQLQHSATVMTVTLSIRLHRKLCESSVPYMSRRLLVHADSWLGSDLDSSLNGGQMKKPSPVCSSMRILTPPIPQCFKTHPEGWVRERQL